MQPPELEEGGQRKARKKQKDNKEELEEVKGRAWAKGVEDTGEGQQRGAKERRKKNKGPAEIWCVNTSGRPQLERVINAASTAEASGKASVVAILNQEHQQPKGKFQDLQHWAQRKGWECSGARAVATEKGGSSAGVLMLTPKGVPLAVKPGCKCDQSPSDAPGRLAVGWIQQVIPCGVMCASLYLWHTEGGSVRNMKLLQTALQAVSTTGCPWIIGMDANNTPQELAHWAAPILTRAGAKIVATGEATNFPTEGAARCIDYFLVADEIVGLVKSVRLIQDVETSPHKIVALLLHKKKETMRQWVLRGPRAFPTRKPIGCAREPVVADWEASQMGETEEGTHKGQTTLEDAWGKTVLAMEMELCGVTDRMGGGAPDNKSCGRERGPRYVRAPILPPRIAGNNGQVDIKMHGMLWARNRLKTLGALAAISLRRKTEQGGGDGLDEGQRKHWQVLVRKITSRGSLVQELASREAKWATFLREIRAYRNCPWRAGDFFETTFDWVQEAIREANDRHTKGKVKSWKRWVGRQLKDGAGAAHAWSKREESVTENFMVINGKNTAAPQDIVEEDFKGWVAIWSRLKGKGGAPWRQGGQEEDQHELPPITAIDLRKASRTFKERTGTGVDKLGPRHYSWLSDQLLGQVASLMMEIEKQGRWPRQMGEATVHLIPKPTGGRRPIGLVASLARLWERVRKPELVRWRGIFTRDYNWMVRGRGAARAVWAQSVQEEAAKQGHRKTTAILYDMVKAFEQVPLVSVWEAGLAAAFPRRMLKLGMELCTFKRRLTYKRAVSMESHYTETAILAGLGMATDFMFLKLVRPLDNLLNEFSEMNIYLIADDIRVGFEDQSEDRLKTSTVKAAKRAIQLFEDEEGMQVSRGEQGKTAVMASTKTIEVEVGKALAQEGIKAVRAAKNLGVDYALRKGNAGNKTQQGRVMKALDRVGRIMRLGGKLAMYVARAALIPSVTYGASVTGMCDGMLATVRAMMAKTRGKMGGRSTSARLYMEEADPGVNVVVEPVMQWVEAWWEGIISKETMEEAWRYAIKEVGMAARPNVKVEGGAGALMASLRRLNWTMPRPDTFRTSDSVLLYFGDGEAPEGTHAADPKAVKKWLLEAHELEIMRNSSIAKDINNVVGAAGYGREKGSARGERQTVYFGETQQEERAAAIWRRPRFQHIEGQIIPWLWPMRCKYRAAKKRGGGVAAASFRALIEGGWWCKARLVEAGAAEEGMCACGKATDTLWHRLAVCELTKEQRQAKCPPEVTAQGAARLWDPLYSRGVPARPKMPKTPKDEVWIERLKEGAELGAEGLVYTDGSAAGWHWMGARAAFGAVCYGGGDEAEWVMRGICGGPHANIVEAELRAVLEVLRVLVGPVTIRVDNAYVVQGFKEGERWTTRAGAEAAGTWRKVWRKMEEVGEWVKVEKVKAHSSWWEVVGGKISYMDYQGNKAADKAAKEALKVALAKAPTGDFNAALMRAVAWARWITTYAGLWADKIKEEEDKGEEAVRKTEEERGEEEDSRIRSTLPHDWWKRRRQLLCRRCGKTGKEEGAKFLRAEACKGSVGGRVLATNTGNRNHIWATCRWSEAELTASGYIQEAPTYIPDEDIWEDGLRDLQGTAVHEWSEIEAALTRIGQGSEELEGQEEEGGERKRRRRSELIDLKFTQAHDTTKGRHAIRTRGVLTWCDVCAAYATERAGSRLMGPCTQGLNRHKVTRLARLRQGRHPITNELL